MHSEAATVWTRPKAPDADSSGHYWGLEKDEKLGDEKKAEGDW